MNRTALTILISIILTIIIVSLVNVGTSLFIEQPEYNNYCDALNRPKVVDAEPVVNETEVQEIQDCYDLYDAALKPYEQKRFYVFALIGFILLIGALFVPEMLLQITGLASGGILVFWGIVSNFQDKLLTFITLLGILIIFGIVAYRVIKRSK